MRAHLHPRPIGVSDPWISQKDPAGAAASGYANGKESCAPTVAAMIARGVGWHPGKTDAQLIEEFQRVGHTGPGGTSPQGMQHILQHMGLNVDQRPGADLGWLRQELRQGHHVAALGNSNALPGKPPTDKVAGHCIEVTGVDRKTGNFRINNPGTPAMTELSPQQLARFISTANHGGRLISAWP